MTRDKAYRLAVIVVLQLVGILAGVQLGKIAPLVEWYQHEIGFSLVLIGWFTSMIGIFVAAAALPAGWAIERAGPANTFLAGSVVMTIGGIALALFASPAAILASRLVEGAGYLVLVIATPALLAAISPDRWKPPVLAIWGGFVPIGFARGRLHGAGDAAVRRPAELSAAGDCRLRDPGHHRRDPAARARPRRRRRRQAPPKARLPRP